MKIAHFVHRYPPALGGSEAFFARLGRYLGAGGDQVRVETTTALDLEAFWSPKARVLPAGAEMDRGVLVRRHTLSHWPGRRYFLKLLSLIPIPHLQALALPCNPIAPTMWNAAELQVDIVHATAFPYAWPILCGLRLARRCGVPFVLTPFLHLGDPRNPRDRTRRSYLSSPMRYLLRSADCVFAQTPGERDALLEIGLPESRVRMLGMGVDPAECTGGNRQTARVRWGLPDDAVVIGHLANKSVEKGTVDLLKAIQRIGQTDKPVRVLLAGPEMPNFVRFWEQLAGRVARPEHGYEGRGRTADSPHALRIHAQGVPHNVKRLGVLTEAEKRDFYAAIDLFALPSRSDSFGLVFLEAWANGVPSLAYRAGGVADVIRHGQDGLLADCGDIGGLAEGLRYLIESVSERQRLGQAGRRRVLAECAWEPRLRFVRETYRRLTSPAAAAA